MLAAEAETNDESLTEGASALGHELDADGMWSEPNPANLMLQPQQFLESVCRIVRESDKCHKNSHSESAWGCQVYNRLLDLALDSIPPEENHLEWLNITTARVWPTGLLPNNVATPNVDFALTLQLPTEKLQTLKDQAMLPVNQSDYPPLREPPIAVNIETKHGSADFTYAKGQISVWVSAQFERFRAVFGDTPPFLPQLIAQGRSWHLVLCWQATNEQGVLCTYVQDHDRPFASTVRVWDTLFCYTMLSELCRRSNTFLRQWMIGRCWASLSASTTLLSHSITSCWVLDLRSCYPT